MYKILLSLGISMLVFTCHNAYSQRNANVGIFAGTAYYLGDINPNRHFYHPSLAFGALYRYNMNTRYALRANAYYARLSASDLDFPELPHPDRPVSPASFNTSILDLCLQVEYNFLPYTPNVGAWEYTPYIAVGFSGALVLSSDAGSENLLNFPFSLGLKFNITDRLAAGGEWSFRKSFSDRIDGLENPSGIQSVIHNNDWYSFMGIFITYKFFNFAAGCPAYEQ